LQVMLLEELEFSPETEAMWQTLCTVAMQEFKLVIAERCCAALGDTARAMYLRKVNEAAEREGMADGTEHFLVKAKMATLDKNFDRASQVLLEQGKVEEAMEMYQELHRWDEAIAISEGKNRPETEELKTSYLQWLLMTSQEEKAAKVVTRNPDTRNPKP
ncbi:putative osmotic avoidance abnormal protein, partial [Baffinella frigidus]